MYHVTARGNERRALFRDDRDREEYLVRAARYRERFRFQLLSYCLMTNHVHLAIRTGEQPLSRIMVGLHSSYAAWFNRRHDRVGHLFQGRYKANVILRQRHLITLVRYIHHNPVRARIVAHAADYRWSSDRYLRGRLAPEWFDIDAVHALLGDTRRAAIRHYVHLMDGPASTSAPDATPAPSDGASDGEVVAVSPPCPTGEPRRPIPGLSIERLLEEVARDAGMPVDTLKGRGRGGAVAAARCVAAYLGSRFGGLSVRRIARHLGRDDSSFVRPLAKLERHLRSDAALRTRLDQIVQNLTTSERTPSA